LGPQAGEALAALLQALKDREPLIRDAVADAIGCIGPRNPDAVFGLEQALTDSNSFVQATAAKALKKIDAARAMS
jgi:HEAT repeat protein